MELNKKTLRNIFLVVAGCIVLYWVLHETERVTATFKTIWSLFSPFAVGAAIAFILNVPMRAIERMLGGIKKAGPRRGLSILLTFLAVFLVLTGVVYLVIPQVIATVETLLAEIPGFVNRVIDWGKQWLAANPELRDWLYENTKFEDTDWSELLAYLFNVISSQMESIVNKLHQTMDQLLSVVDVTFKVVVAFANGVFNAVLSLVFALYCLARKEILARQGRRLLYAILPEKIGDETVRILRMTNATFSNFISGQCLEAVILGAMFMVSMSIFRMPYMPLVSVLIAVTALVPIVGAFVGCILGAFFILVDDPMMAVWFVVMFLILQQIEGNLIYPRVVGTSIGLPGMWVLVAVGVGGDLMGVGGMLIMIPFASVLYALAREYSDKRLEAKGIPAEKLQDQPPALKSNFKVKREKNKNKWLSKLTSGKIKKTDGEKE